MPCQESACSCSFYKLRLNEKHLRDLAGPLTAADMSALFNPVPFGGMRDSPLTQIREDPEAAAVWDSFRNIDPEKESKVLQVRSPAGAVTSNTSSSSGSSSRPRGMQHVCRVAQGGITDDCLSV